MKARPIQKGGPTIFRQIIVPFLVASFAVITLLQVSGYFYQKDLATQELKSRFSESLAAAAAYFDAIYALPVQNDLKFIENSYAFNYFLSSQKNEILLTKPLAEKLFLHFTNRGKGIYLSLRFLDAAGVEKIVTEGSKRKKDYASLLAYPQDVLHSGISDLFSHLITEKPGTISCGRPFEYQGRWTFLVGITKSEPETGGTAGAAIFHCDLTEYFTRLAGYTFFGERVAAVESLDHERMFPSLRKGAAAYPGKGHDFYNLSKEIRLGPDDQGLFTVVFGAPSDIFNKETKNIFRRFLLILFASLLFISFIVWVIAGKFSRPLAGLMDAVQRFAKGDVSARVHVKTTGEIQMVSEAFNKMAEDLEKTMVSRDSLVKEMDERRRAEVALRESQQLLERIMNAISVRVFWKDKNLFYLGCNAVFAQDAGFADPKDVIGKDDHQMAWRDQAELYRGDDRQVIESGHPKLLIEEFQTTSGGDTRTLLTNKIPMCNPEGEIIGVLGTYMDITDRKRAEENLERVSQKNELILNSVTEGILGLDLKGHHTFVNAAAARMFGYDVKELIGRSSHALWHHTKADGSPYSPEECPIYKALASGFFHQGSDEMFWRKDGTSFPVDFSCVPVLSKGVITGAVMTFSDITDRKKIVEVLRQAHNELELRVRERTAELAESQAHIQKILATITDYIYTATVRDGVAVAVTRQPNCLAVTGYTAEEFENQPGLGESMIHEEDRPKVRAFFAAVLAGKEMQPMEHRIWRKDGKIRWVRNAPVLHYDSSGRLTSWDGIISDITEKKQAEMSLTESMEKLSHANRVKDQFLANMSHEVRTPLNAIIGFSSLLKSTSLDPVQKGYVEMLYDGGEILLSLITDVIDFSRITSGEVRLEKINFDLERLIQGMIKTHSGKLKKKDLRIFYTMDEKVPHGFRGDPARIRRTLAHLLSNAIKFTEKGEVEVRVTLDREVQDRGSKSEAVVRIAVMDTGTGIPQDKREAIFEAFEQADVSTTRKYGGMGLGLSLSKTLVNLMKGRIEVRSESGKGSTFSVVLPLEVESVAEEVQIFPLKDEELEGKKILILDDDEMTLEIFIHYCEEAKMVVSHSASSAQEALEWLSKQTSLPDIFLADILMPHSSGYEVAEKVRENKKYETIKLIAVTVDAFEGAAAKARQSGFDAFLAKPASRENLMKVIKTVLGDKREKILPVEIVTQYTAGELAYKGLKILVVEDNPASQELFSILLKNFGFNVEIASEGREAVEKVKKDPYDLILMDLQMPVMGGVEATRIIREQLHKTMPILALTAGVSDDDKEKCLAAGMNDYLMKPVEVPRLKDKILHYIEGISRETPASRKEEGVVKWDKQKALKELGLPAGLYRELVLGFIKQSAEAIQNLEKAFQERNFEEVAKAAHFIKGAAGNLRIEEAYGIAKELEAVAKGDRDTGRIEKLMGSLEHAMEEVKKNI